MMDLLAQLKADLPAGWVSVRLGDIATPSKEKVDPNTCPDEPYLSLEHIEAHTTRILGYGRAADVRSTKTVFRPGDVLYGKLRPYLNKVAIADREGVCSTDILVFPRRSVVLPHFLLSYLSQPALADYAHHRSTGVELPRVSFAALSELPFPLPPLPEQQRIVARTAQLLTKVNTARERLLRTSDTLDHFRRAILELGFRGRLTADWRENRELESAAALRARLSSVLQGRSKRALPIQDEVSGGEYQLPQDWRWTRIGEVFEVKVGATPSRANQLYWNGEIPWVSSGEVRFRRITETAERITQLGLTESSTQVNPPGTVLLAMIGEGKTRGQAAILDVPACNNQNSAAIRLDESGIPPEFVFYWLMLQYEATRSRGVGTGPPALNSDRVREIPVPLPPLKEQEEIVRRVNSLFSAAEQISNRVAAAKALVERLPQAVIAKAFRGELVPTEAELAGLEGHAYETGEMLLRRTQLEEALNARNVGQRSERKMRRISDAELGEQILELCREPMTFGELRSRLGGSYESLKDAVFRLLEAQPARLLQRYNPETQAMSLVQASK